MIFFNYLRRAKPTANRPARMLQYVGNAATCGTFVPEDDGPTVIVVGSRAPRKALACLARKHGLELAALETFARQEIAHA